MPANHCMPHTLEARLKMSASHRGIALPHNRRATRVENGVTLYQCGGKCKEFFPASGFYKNKRTILGLTSECRKCHGITSMSSRNSETARLINKRYMQRRRAKNPAEVRAYERTWSGLKRAKRQGAVPKWLTAAQKKEIREFYRQCPKGNHVDHIVPIRGRSVCGLHVLWNLQYLPAAENLSKGNKLSVS